MAYGHYTPFIPKSPFSTFKSSRSAPSPPRERSRSLSAMFLSNISPKRGASDCEITSKVVSQQNAQFRHSGYSVFPSPDDRVKAGYIGLQRDKLHSLTWTRNFWMVLRRGVLCVSQKDNSEVLYYLSLNEVHQIDRVASRRFCIAVIASSQVWYIMFKDEYDLEDWLREIRPRCPLLHIGYPTDFKHDLHVTYDPKAGEITGLPEPWIQTLSVWGVRPDFTIDGIETPPLSTGSGTSGLASSSSGLSRSLSSATAMTPPATPNPAPPPLSRHRSASEMRHPPRSPSMVTSVDHFRKSPHRCCDIAARNLTGNVKTVHLLPTIRDENCDIWKAEWTGSFGTRKVAMQVIRVPNVMSEEECKSLTAITISEMRVLHQLRHPNVVRIRGFTQDQGPVPAIISTWLPRGNLMDYLAYHTPTVGRVERLRYLTEAAAGLNYLHNFSQEILHGNFRGAHILLNDTGHVCISGFGINPILQELERPDTRDVTARTGPSPRWAAVEVICSERRQMSSFSDVFSFARTVVEVMTGKPPYYYVADDEEVIPIVIKGILPRRPPIFGEDGLWQFLERCWREDFRQRPSMALALLRMEETLGLYSEHSRDRSEVPTPKSA